MSLAWEKRAAVCSPTTKRVATQEANWRANWRQLTPAPILFQPLPRNRSKEMFSARPMPTTAPVIHWDEDVGSPYLQEQQILSAETFHSQLLATPSSAQLLHCMHNSQFTPPIMSNKPPDT